MGILPLSKLYAKEMRVWEGAAAGLGALECGQWGLCCFPCVASHCRDDSWRLEERKRMEFIMHIS